MTAVSAIVSAYYSEKYLKGRLENLRDQTLVPQIVVICQFDSAEMKIAVEFQHSHEMLISPTPDIPTVYEAWNIGLGSCSGEYITSANSDDRLDPDAIRLLSKTLDKHKDYAVAYPDVNRVDKIGGAPIGSFVWKEGQFGELMSGCFVGPMPMWRKSLHEKYGFFDGEYASAGDYEFWLRIAYGGEKFKHVNRILGDHLERPAALEHRSPIRTTWETARARAKYRSVA